MWAYVTPHFQRFLANLELTPAQRTDGNTKAWNVAKCLHARYYGGEFDKDTALLVGSFGKGTATRPKSDIDVLFILPPHIYQNVGELQGNKQSQLLQHVRLTLLDTFSQTKELSADGQVVQVPFDTYEMEVIPAFRSQQAGVFLVCNTANGGSWRATNPAAEWQYISSANKDAADKATHLIKMLKVWKQECNVPIKSLGLEIAATAFILTWLNRRKSFLWYDWMVRDFFYFLLQHQNSPVLVSGITEQFNLGAEWAPKCTTAYRHSLRACYFEQADLLRSAEQEWKEIFGGLFPAL